jgi:hypothetical protein
MIRWCMSETTVGADHLVSPVCAIHPSWEMGRWGDGEMGSWGDGELGRWGAKEPDNLV